MKGISIRQVSFVARVVNDDTMIVSACFIAEFFIRNTGPIPETTFPS